MSPNKEKAPLIGFDLIEHVQCRHACTRGSALLTPGHGYFTRSFPIPLRLARWIDRAAMPSRIPTLATRKRTTEILHACWAQKTFICESKARIVPSRPLIVTCQPRLGCSPALHWQLPWYRRMVNCYRGSCWMSSSVSIRGLTKQIQGSGKSRGITIGTRDDSCTHLSRTSPPVERFSSRPTRVKI